jgi:hypothetical protein
MSMQHLTWYAISTYAAVPWTRLAALYCSLPPWRRTAAAPRLGTLAIAISGIAGARQR